MRWDLFCRVVDNFGDIGVCWRLAVELAGRGEQVRLWVDDASALAWMAPRGAPGVSVQPWSGAHAADSEAGQAEAVIEAFGCSLPDAVLARMAQQRPVWLNLEYLSAEPYVQRCHGLLSPVQHGPAAGLAKWFFYPGFTPGTGGLLRGRDTLVAGDGRPWPQDPAARVATVFCYPTPSLARLVRTWPGQVRLAGNCGREVRGPRLSRLGWTDQPGFDTWLGASDLNIVRGEDSFVRAQWAARPFIWHIYAQHDDAHHAKLDAFVEAFVAGTPPAWAAELRAVWLAWNGRSPWPARWPDQDLWLRACQDWRRGLAAQDDLVTRLLAFVASRRP